MDKVELLSPAGNFDKMDFAFRYGADAVYIGSKIFSLREGAANFTLEELSKAVLYAHDLKKKIYLAANIFYHNRHLKDFYTFLEEIKSIPLDGIVMSDLGAIAYVREKYPEISVHISTQANTTNRESVEFYEKIGATRVVLARELSLDEIKEIRDHTSIELETFIHGAMCIAYSGRCLISNYFTNRSNYRKDEKMGVMKKIKTRDANSGDCSQSCRWDYHLVETSREGEFLPIEENEAGTALLSSKDLNLSSHLSELMEAGINSFKIEGRMKSIYYAANVTRVYRKIIDDIHKGARTDPSVFNELNTISHREYTTGFYFQENLALTPTQSSKYIREYTFLGHILEKNSPHSYTVQAMNQIQSVWDIEAIGPDMENVKLSGYKMIKNNTETSKIQPNDIFIMEVGPGVDLGKYFILRKKID